jgi:hypothetical protein
MVGRFNVREGSGDEDWSVWDNAANGSRGAGLSEPAAINNFMSCVASSKNAAKSSPQPERPIVSS